MRATAATEAEVSQTKYCTLHHIMVESAYEYSKPRPICRYSRTETQLMLRHAVTAQSLVMRPAADTEACHVVLRRRQSPPSSSCDAPLFRTALRSPLFTGACKVKSSSLEGEVIKEGTSSQIPSLLFRASLCRTRTPPKFLATLRQGRSKKPCAQ